MYRFWYRRYFLDIFTRYFGNFFLINLRYFPRKASSKSIAKPRCCRSVVGNHRAAAPYRISGKVDLPDIQYPVIRQICYPAHPELQITKFKKKIIKKFPNARAGQTAGRFQIFFCSSPIFSGKIVDLRRFRPFLFLLINALWGQFGPTLFEKWRLCKKG